jgi:hypothetical protein
MAMPERSWFIAEGKGGRHRMSHPVIDARRWRVTRPAPQPRPTIGEPGMREEVTAEAAG